MELWDIYDENKRLTGRTMQRNDWNMKPGEYHLTVLGVIRHTNGRYLITKRVMTKSWAPGWWEVSGGGVMAGEDSRTAVLREIREETGLDVSDWEGGYLFSYRRDNPKEQDNYFVDVYRFTGDFSRTSRSIGKTTGKIFAAFSFLISCKRCFEISSVSLFKAVSSISYCIIFLEISSNSVGIDSISVFIMAHASSIKSIALSGKNLSDI